MNIACEPDSIVNPQTKFAPKYFASRLIFGGALFPFGLLLFGHGNLKIAAPLTVSILLALICAVGLATIALSKIGHRASKSWVTITAMLTVLLTYFLSGVLYVFYTALTQPRSRWKFDFDANYERVEISYLDFALSIIGSAFLAGIIFTAWFALPYAVWIGLRSCRTKSPKTR